MFSSSMGSKHLIWDKSTIGRYERPVLEGKFITKGRFPNSIAYYSWAIQQYGESLNTIAIYGNIVYRYGEVSNLSSRYG